MDLDLAPMRRAQELLRYDSSADDVVKELQLLFRLDFVDAMAAVAAGMLLLEHGATIPGDQFVRPYMTRHDRLSA